MPKTARSRRRGENTSAEPKYKKVRTQPPAAANHTRRPAIMIKFRGARGTVRGEIIVAQNYDCVAVRRMVGNDPKSSGQAKQRRAHQVNQHAENHEGNQDNQFRKDAAALSR